MSPDIKEKSFLFTQSEERLKREEKKAFLLALLADVTRGSYSRRQV
jgi:hypothetical protein